MFKRRLIIGILLSSLIHSLMLVLIRSDQADGRKETPIEVILVNTNIGISSDLKLISPSHQNKKNIRKTKKLNAKIKNDKIVETINSKTNFFRGNKAKTKQKKEIIEPKEELVNYHENSELKIGKLRGNKGKVQKDLPERGFLKGKGIKLITCLNCVKPIYSQRSIRKGIQGVSIVKVWINADGKVTKALLIKTSGSKDIDFSSLKAALKTTFKPLTNNTSIQIRYDHIIKDR